MNGVQSSPPAWWQAPTVIVAAGCLIALITYGLRTSFGLFIDPLSDGRGWGREVFALSLAIQNLVWGLGQPAAGKSRDPLRRRAIERFRGQGQVQTNWKSESEAVRAERHEQRIYLAGQYLVCQQTPE